MFDDADLDAAVEGALQSKYRNAGQTCVCANRLLVHEKMYDAFAAKLTERVRSLRVGDGIEPGVTIGPLINAEALAKREGGKYGIDEFLETKYLCMGGIQ